MPFLSFLKKKEGAGRNGREDGCWLIVGLGNPGVQYEHTRHNTGFDCLDELARDCGIALNRHRCKAQVGEGRIEGRRAILAKPDTFMNLSGESVAELARYYKVPVQRILVIYDDIDIPFGALRLRKSGGPGTHNGMKNIVACLQDEGFPRIRVGVGAPPKGWDMVDYVLGRVAPGQREDARAQHALAAQAAKEAVVSGMDAAMQKFNTKRSQE